MFTQTQTHTCILVTLFLFEQVVNWKTRFLVISHLNLSPSLK